MNCLAKTWPQTCELQQITSRLETQSPQVNSLTGIPVAERPLQFQGLELTLLESESFPLSGRSWRGRAGVPEDGLRSVSPGRPPGLRPLARAHSGWPQAADSESDSARRNFKLAGELDLVFQAPAGRVMGQFSYSKAVPQTGPARVRVQGVGSGREDRHGHRTIPRRRRHRLQP